MSKQDDRDAINQRLASLQGWTEVTKDIFGIWVGVPPSDLIVSGHLNAVHIQCGAGRFRHAPNYFGNAAASHQLVVWISQQSENVKATFINNLGRRCGLGDLNDLGLPFEDRLLRLMTAPMSDIARAADAATKA